MTYKTIDFINKAKLKHGDIYDYSNVEYINVKNKVIITCKRHGEFLQTPSDHLSGNGCKYCGIESRKLIRTKTTLQFINEATLKHLHKYDYSKTIYTSSIEKIIIICKEHGKFEQLPNSHLRGAGCKQCSTKYSGLIKRSNTNDFINKAKLIHGDKYDYSNVNYGTAIEKVAIICKIHGEFETSPNAHLNNKVGCSKCSKKYSYTTEKWIEKAKSIHGEKYDYSKVNYINCETNIKIICKKHGEFEQRPQGHLNGHSCVKCANNYQYTTEEWIEIAKSIHGEKYDYSKVNYGMSKEKVVIICKTHGEFEQQPNVHLSCYGCSKCSNRYQYTTEEWIEKAKSIHGDKYDYSKVNYGTAKEKIAIICKKHGEFLKIPREHLGLRQSGCQRCEYSNYSKLSIQYLDFISKLNNIKIQHAENDGEFLISNTKYKADGYCHETNTVYEFNGDYWHGNPNLFIYDKYNKTTNCRFGELYKRTLEREQLIKKLGFNLVTMWEYDWNKLNKSIRTLQRQYRKYNSNSSFT